MGAGSDVNAFFGIVTMFIGIPTGVQMFNWLATMWKGKITFTSPMYWFMGFVSTFTFGGMAGMLMASPGADYQVHNSLFLVAHFHTMVIGGALFGIFAGITYWWPKVTGFKLNEKLGKTAFWFWLVGFFVSFTPLYILGFMGATRRMDHYAAGTGYQPFFITAAIGVAIIGIGVAIQVLQVIVSVKNRKQNLVGNDPWDGRTLEWAASSPPKEYNFAVTPVVHGRDAFWDMKREAASAKPPKYEDIEAPRNTGMAIYVSAFFFIFGFAAVWHILWLAIVGLVGAIVCVIARSFDEHTHHIIPAAEVEKMETERTFI